MAALTDEQVAKLKADNNARELACVTLPDGTEFFFKPPTRQQYDKWFDQIGDKVSASANARELATACLVHPSYDVFMATLDKYPALLVGKNGFQDACTSMSGFVSGGMASIKKL